MFLIKEKPDLLTYLWDSKKPFDKPFKERNIIKDDLLRLKHSTVTNLVKLEIIKMNKLFFNENIKYGEDILFWYSTLKYIQNVYRINCCIYIYREHEDSIMHHKKTIQEIQRRIKDELIVIDNLRQFEKEEVNSIKKDLYKKMAYFGCQRVMRECLPYSGYSYKECLKIIKDNKLIFPFKYRVKAIKNFKNKSFSQKLKKIYSVYFPKLHFRAHYKKENRKGL